MATVCAALRHQQAELADAETQMTMYSEGSPAWDDARRDRDYARMAVDRLQVRLAAAGGA